MIERKFVQENQNRLDLEEYLSSMLSDADYSHTDIMATPLSTRLDIYVGRPGVAIGRAGKNIELITTILKERFKIKNPQIDIKSIAEPDLDAKVIAKRIASALERRPGGAMRLVHIYLDRIMKAGAVGAEISVGGKISGGRGRHDKAQVGYIKKAGDIASKYVETGFARAVQKPGVLGIKVKIMQNLPESVLLEKRIKSGVMAEKKKEEEKKKAEEEAEKAPDEKKEREEVEKAEKKEPLKKEAKKAVKKTEKKPAKRPAEKKAGEKPEAKRTAPKEKKPVKKQAKKKAAKKTTKKK